MSCERSGRRGDAPSFVHLRRLTDDTGLLEHALGRIPRRQEGYTTDDNARALWCVTEWLDPRHGPRIGEGGRRTLLELADIYLAFLLWTQKENGWFHNNVAYDRTPEPEGISHDCQGRALWSCADAWVRLPDGRRETAYILFQNSLRTIGEIGSHRGQAFAMAACAHLLEASARGIVRLPGGWEAELRHHLHRLEALLCGAFRHFSRGGGWRWFEPAMTYGNGVLPWAMLRAFRVTRRAETLEIGLGSLSSLQKAMTAESGCWRPIGNASWRTRESGSRWDQQPLELFKLALALEEAIVALESARLDGVSLLVAAAAPDGGGSGGAGGGSGAGGGARGGTLTAEPGGGGSAFGGEQVVDLGEHVAALRRSRDRCLDWFHGDNDLRAPMVDAAEGSCCDGLQENGPNLNCGAEAALSYLMVQALCGG